MVAIMATEIKATDGKVYHLKGAGINLYTVSSIDGDKAKIAQYGGGWVLEVPISDLTETTFPSNYELKMVECCENHKSKAWVNPARLWNGWLMPCFEKPAMEAIVKEIQEDLNCKPYYKVYWQGETVICENLEHLADYPDDKEYGIEEFKPSKIRTPYGWKTVWDFKCGDWCWESAEPEDE